MPLKPFSGISPLEPPSPLPKNKNKQKEVPSFDKTDRRHCGQSEQAKLLSPVTATESLTQGTRSVSLESPKNVLSDQQ